MKIIEKLRKFFTPYKWETIWTGKATGWITENGKRIAKTELICFVQIDRNKNILQSYGTNGTIEKDVDLNWLTAQSEELKNILIENGMPVK